MDYQQAFNGLTQKLSTIYEKSEAEHIADWILEAITGKRKWDLAFAQAMQLTGKQQIKLETYAIELLEYRPVQYVLGESYFYNLKLFVDEHVLIPRPETEELVHWIINSLDKQKSEIRIVDIGTGSGCIALALKSELPKAAVFGLDISEQALAIARRNANDSGLDVVFKQLDILDNESYKSLPVFDAIVSNPPYITIPEKQHILPNVLGYEPHQALFVTDDDPLQFYKAIEKFSKKRLANEGFVYLEVHRDFAVETELYFKQKGWFTHLRKDMQGNDRMLRCRKIKFS